MLLLQGVLEASSSVLASVSVFSEVHLTPEYHELSGLYYLLTLVLQLFSTGQAHHLAVS